jgi:hypothetical protein
MAVEDPLYQIFVEHLHSGLYDDLPVEQLIRDVVEFYWTAISRDGHIPHRLREPLKVDLIQDVQDMLKTKTYGHYGVSEYNRNRRKKSS